MKSIEVVTRPFGEGSTEVANDTGKAISVVRESDRTLIYLNARYHLIAEADVNVKVGDMVEFTPFGVNFGWFVQVK